MREAWRRLYGRKAWRLVRRTVFARDGYICRNCRRVCSGVYPDLTAPVCDHIIMARVIYEQWGESGFYNTENLQTLCTECHNGAKQHIEQRKYNPAVASDGWPVDPLHPANNPACAKMRKTPPRG